jgi:hypothetical protein
MDNQSEIQNPNPVIFQTNKLDKEFIYKRKQEELNDKFIDQVDNLESNF